MPIRRPDGFRTIEALRVGDMVLSRDENDLLGEVSAKMVEEVFVRNAAIWIVVMGGEEVRTTGEHPFYVEGKGWLAVHEMSVGDRVLCLDGSSVEVEKIEETGDWEQVYNVRIADWHTYFVGTQEWGFAAWAHNTAACVLIAFRDEHELPPIGPNVTNPNFNSYRVTVAYLQLQQSGQFAVSPNAGGSEHVLAHYKMTDRTVKESYRRIINSTPGPQFTKMPQVLGHAEFAALYLAYEQNGALPKYLKMDTDRPLCTFANGCLENLHRVLETMGVEKLFIRDASDDYYKLTPSTPATLQGRISLSEWEPFDPKDH